MTAYTYTDGYHQDSSNTSGVSGNLYNLNNTLVQNDVTSAEINPSYSEGESSTCMFSGLKPVELVNIALGKPFKTSKGTQVNDTYTNWLSNLTSLLTCGHISREMMIGFLNLNMYNHKKDGSTDTPSTDNTTNNNTGKDIRPVCCGKPYIV